LDGIPKDSAALDARVERRLAIRELDTKAEHGAVVLDAASNIVDREHGRGADQ
jgi:hypothetical protein